MTSLARLFKRDESSLLLHSDTVRQATPGTLFRSRRTRPIGSGGRRIGEGGAGGAGASLIGEDDDRLTVTTAMIGNPIPFQLSYISTFETPHVRMHFGGIAADEGGLLDSTEYTITPNGVVKIPWQTIWATALAAGLVLQLSARYLHEDAAEYVPYTDELVFRADSGVASSSAFASIPFPTAAVGDLIVVTGSAVSLAVSDGRLTQVPGTNVWYGIVGTDMSDLQISGAAAGGASANSVSVATYYNPAGGTLLPTVVTSADGSTTASMSVPSSDYGSAVLAGWAANGIGGTSLATLGSVWTQTHSANAAYSDGRQWLVSATDDSATSPADTIGVGGPTPFAGYALIGVKVLAP